VGKKMTVMTITGGSLRTAFPVFNGAAKEN
jgi:hypothetical protein